VAIHACGIRNGVPPPSEVETISNGGSSVKLYAATAGLLVVLAIGFAVPAIAGKPEKPYLNVDMSTAAASSVGSSSTSSMRLSGCGYSKLTTVIVWHNGTGPYQEVTPDENGCVSASFTSWGSGDYIGQSWQKQGQGWDKSAEVSFSVS
jgi:hypothetical protein